jgi:TorA maturation chaperone TorD
MNRDVGLEEAIRAAGSIGALARGLGITQPSVSSWRRIPGDRVLAVEGLTGIARSALRPDLYPPGKQDAGGSAVDEVDEARAQHYGLLAALLLRAPDALSLARLARLQGTPTPLGLALIGLAQAAASTTAERQQREFFDLFIGVGRGELVPYASYYLTGFLHDRPLARLRGDLARLGLARTEARSEPEDHIGTLCEIMSGFADGRFPIAPEEEKQFFKRFLAAWAPRFFADLQMARPASFYKAVGALGGVFMEIEAEAFAMEN